MKLCQVSWTYGEHEMESEIFAANEGTTTEGREYLISMYGKHEGDYMHDAIKDPSLLTVESVAPFNTVHDLFGSPYKVTLQQ
jgi:hypothetical protein